jgi:molybdopterin synthase catalytic subunit
MPSSTLPAAASDEVRLTRDPIEVSSLAVASPADGAVALFLGVVRGTNAGREVAHLEYEAYQEMAEAELAAIVTEARARWPITGVRVVHRLGRLEIGEASVAVAVASPHRREAFEACRFVIDALKKRAPIWKKEFYTDGSAWLEGPGGVATQ